MTDDELLNEITTTVRELRDVIYKHKTETDILLEAYKQHVLKIEKENEQLKWKMVQ